MELESVEALWQPVITAAVIARAKKAVRIFLIFMMSSSFQFTLIGFLFFLRSGISISRVCKVRKRSIVKST